MKQLAGYVAGWATFVTLAMLVVGGAITPNVLEHPDAYPQLSGLFVAGWLSTLLAGAGLFVAMDAHVRRLLETTE